MGETVNQYMLQIILNQNTSIQPDCYLLIMLNSYYIKHIRCMVTIQAGHNTCHTYNGGDEDHALLNQIMYCYVDRTINVQTLRF